MSSAREPAPGHALTMSRVVWLFLPLAASWVLMALEGPISTGVAQRMANSELATASLVPLMSIAIWIEAPVIDLLSTGATWGSSRAAMKDLLRFALMLMAWVTLAHGVVVFTPLYEIVTLQLLGLKPELADYMRPGLQLMLFWSAFIGLRRVLQGVLIRHGLTVPIGVGTAIRCVAMLGISVGLFRFSDWDSMHVIGTALIGSVVAESVYIAGISIPTLRRMEWKDPDAPGPGLRALWKFHWPLTATTFVTMFASPMVIAAVSRTPNSILHLGALQMVNNLVWLFRTTTFALPEVVISQAKDAASERLLARFSLGLGLLLTGLLVVFAASPLFFVVFSEVLGATGAQLEVARIGLFASLLLPLIGGVQGFFRGILTKRHLTSARLAAIFVSITSLALFLALGLRLGLPGIVLAALAPTLALLAETVVLGIATARSAATSSEIAS